MVRLIWQLYLRESGLFPESRMSSTNECTSSMQFIKTSSSSQGGEGGGTFPEPVFSFADVDTIVGELRERRGSKEFKSMLFGCADDWLLDDCIAFNEVRCWFAKPEKRRWKEIRFNTIHSISSNCQTFLSVKKRRGEIFELLCKLDTDFSLYIIKRYSFSL